MSALTVDERPLRMAGRVAVAVPLVAAMAIAVIDPFSTMFYLVYAVPGFVLAVRRPRQLLGWLLIGIAFGFLGTTVPLDVDVARLVAGTATWRDFLFVWVGAWSGYATFSLFVALMLVFPSGHLPTHGRRVAQALLSGCAALCVLSATAPSVGFNPDQGVATVLVPNRFAVLSDVALWQLVPFDLLILPMVVAMLIGVGWMLGRYRRSTGVERLQLRWLVASLAAVVLAIVAGLGSLAVLGDIGGAAWIPAIVAYPTVPLAILVAVTRYRLYEIDRLISRTVSWLAITVVLAAVFAGAVVGLQAALQPFTANNTLAVAGSTLLAAALFQPLRRRIQHVVDRRFNRARIDAERVAAGFAELLRAVPDASPVAGELLAAVDRSLHPQAASVWLRHTGARR